MPDLEKSKGWEYIQATKFSPETLADFDRPEILAAKSWFKEYPGVPKITLPRHFSYTEANLWQIIGKRRSLHDFQETEISAENLGLILWAAQGLTAQKGPYFLRNTPSAGALYPVETYVCIERVTDIESGIYHFNCKEFALEQVRCGSNAKEMQVCGLGQEFCGTAAFSFVWTAFFRRNMVKYGHRGMRYILLEMGHIAQNTALALTALGLNGCPVAAFYDDMLADLLKIDGKEESPLYFMSCGKKNGD